MDSIDCQGQNLMITGNAVANGVVVFLIVIIAHLAWERIVHDSRRKKVIALFTDDRDAEAVKLSRDWDEGRLPRVIRNRIIGSAIWRPVSNLLTRAGFYSLRSFYVFGAIELIAVFLGITLVAFGAINGINWVSAALLLVAIALLPIVFVALRGNERVRKMTDELPVAVDLLVQGVSGGLGLTDAMKKATKYQPGPLSSELNRTLDEMLLGTNRAHAFRRLARRIGSSEVKRFAEAIVNVDQLGLSLRLVLLSQSRAIRTRRLTNARVRAEKVSVKIMLPVILCFLPGIFIVTVAPAIFDVISTLQRP